MRRTKIVCTLGPASESPEVIAELVEAGMDVARLNLSHGRYEEHERRMAHAREASRATGKSIGIMLDISGPKIRTGPVRGGAVELASGRPFTLTTKELEGDETVVTVNYPKLGESLKKGSTVYIDDGLLELVVDKVTGENIRCKVVSGGRLSSRKGVTLPGVPVDLPPVTEKDRADIRFGAAGGVDFVAASFVRRARDVEVVRELVVAAGGNAHIVAKVESAEGVSRIDEIIDAADGIMVARGDLGVETPPEKVPLIQKMIIDKCNRAGKPVITATQMLESMKWEFRPTRAEVTDVANAILDGTDAVMLSGETAVGKHPVESVRMMARIALGTEEALRYDEVVHRKGVSPSISVADAISHATCQSAYDLDIKAILCSTQSGATARMVSKYRPKALIVAVTPAPEVVRKLCLVWGVYPVVMCPARNIDEMLDLAVEAGIKSGLVEKGDLVAITAGVRTGVPGSTNLLKVHRIGET